MKANFALMGIFAFTLVGCGGAGPENYVAGTLSPERLDPQARAQAWQTFRAFTEPASAVSSMGGVVVDATVAPSALAGAATLDAGGSAIDAALSAALTSTVVGMGGPVSVGGIAALVYYDASTKSVHSVDGGWKVPAGESEIGSIPEDEASGRAIFVPGFMALVQSAHDRFGRLPFSALFESAIDLADEGFELSEGMARMVEANRAVLGRLPETQDIFVSQAGDWIQAGDVFRQPRLAETLRRVAAEGARYMYEGDWAEALVQAVREEGGYLTLEDLSSYEAAWSEAAQGEYGEYTIHVPGGQATGGTQLIEAMQLLDRARVRDRGPVFESAESLYWVSRIGYLLGPPGSQLSALAQLDPDISADIEARRSPEHADALWRLMQTDQWDDFIEADPFSGPAETPLSHTDAIVAVDRWGNAAAVIFTTNIQAFGLTGLFVEGVSVPDFGRTARQFPGIEPGGRVANPLNPVLVLRDGELVVGAAALGAGLHHATMQTLVNVLDFGMDPLSATMTPQALHFAWPGAPGVPPGTPMRTHVVEEGQFSAPLLDSVRALGQPILAVPESAADMLRGRVSLVVANAATGTLSAVGSLGGLAAPANGGS